MIEIPEDILEKLDRLSLVSYITIQNSFSGLYMTQQFRRWICSSRINIGEHQVEFNSAYANNMSLAIIDTYNQVVEYIKSKPDLLQYWEEE